MTVSITEEPWKNYMDGCFEEQLALLRALGKIPAPSRHEDLRADFCRKWFLETGAKNVRMDSMKNVICEWNCENNQELIVFAAHTDVVFPDIDDLPLREDEERIYAPGIGDDTANLVNLLMGARYLIQNDIRTRYGLLFVANTCEEGLGNLDGTKALFEQYGSRIKAFYSFDCYMPICCNSAVGSYRYEVSCRTKGGHSYTDFGAPNAIEILCALVEELYKIKPPAEEGKTTYNVGRIEGGTTVNSIAQNASMLYEFRSSSQKNLEKMEEAFMRSVNKFRDTGAAIEVKLLGVRPGNGFLDQEALNAFTEQSMEIIGVCCRDDIDCAPKSTDSNIPLSRGILANTIGTVKGSGAHTREEWVEKESMKQGLRIVLALMMKYSE